MRPDHSSAAIARLRDFGERFPEIWMLAVSAAAWLVLVARAGVPSHHAGPAANWRHWMIMVVAMMLPLQIDGVRLTSERSLRLRRQRAILGYLLGYLGVWALAGALLAWGFASWGISHRIEWTQGTAIGFLLASAWLVSPWKAAAARMCHRTMPLAPVGWRADRDCLWSGCLSGCSCALNCWPLMLVCWLSAHSLIAMILAFGLGCVDRHGAPKYRLHATAAAAFGVLSRF
jgi:hypothetical protein